MSNERRTRRIPVWVWFLGGFFLFFTMSVALTYHFGKKVFWKEYYALPSEPGFNRGQSEFLLAVVDGRLPDVQKLVARGVNIDTVAAECSMLNHAIVQSQPDVAVWLIQHGANLSLTCQDGTPYQFAATFGFPQVVEALLERGVNIDEKLHDAGDANALHAAASGNLLRAQVKSDALNESPVTTPEGARAEKWFANSNSSAVIQVLLRKKIKGLESRNIDGETPLFVAVAANDLESVKILLDHGANVDAKNHEGETPLMMAYAYAEEDVVELLLKKGANRFARSKAGLSPKAYAQGEADESEPDTESL